jgi:hypothetical protein
MRKTGLDFGPTFWTLGLFLSIWIFLPAAKALVTEPSGAAVPLDSHNGEIQLYTFFSDQGEAINWHRKICPQAVWIYARSRLVQCRSQRVGSAGLSEHLSNCTAQFSGGNGDRERGYS